MICPTRPRSAQTTSFSFWLMVMTVDAYYAMTPGQQKDHHTTYKSRSNLTTRADYDSPAHSESLLNALDLYQKIITMCRINSAARLFQISAYL